MYMQSYTLDTNELVTVHVVSSTADTGMFLDWIDRQNAVAVDTETTGLDLFSDTFRVRAIQFGNTTEAWVLLVDADPGLVEVARVALDAIPAITFHNANR